MMEQAEWDSLRTAFNRVLDSETAEESGLPGTAQQEADELLLHLKQAEGFLDLDSARSPARFLPGTLVSDRYQVIASLGSGNTGDVYEVHDLELNEIIALKMLRLREATSLSTVERLRRELRHNRRIVHRNVCRQFDFGYHEHGSDRRAYITMECVRGETLAHYLKNHGRPASEKKLALAHQLCDGIQAAHQRQIVHGDLKPQNCMVEHSSGRLVILDFGLSRQIQVDDFAGGTNSQLIAGTPAYLAPERYEGSPASYASDLFSLGVMLHELAASALPPATRDATGRRKLGAGLPQNWAGAITSCLALNAADRPSSAQAVWEMLDGRPAHAAHGRNRAIAASISLLAIAGTAAFLSARQSESRPKQVSSEPILSHSQHPEAADLFHSGQYYLARLTQPSIVIAIRQYEQGLAQKPQDAEANAQLARAYEREYELTHQAQWLAKAETYVLKAQALAPEAASTLLARGLVERSRHQWMQAEQDLTKATALDPYGGEAWKQLARTRNEAGDVLGAEATFQKGIAYNHAYWALYQEFGLFYLGHNQYEQAEQQFLAGLQLSPDQPILLANLGGLYLNSGRLAEAEKTLEAASKLEPSAAIRSNLGAVYLRLGKLQASVEQFRLACELMPSDYRLWNNLGRAQQLTGKLPEAQQSYKQALTLLKDSLATAGRDATVLAELAIYAARSGDMASAASYEAEAISLGPSNPELYLQAANAEAIGGNTSRSLEFLTKALNLGVSPQKVAASSDLTNLRTNAEFQRLVGKSQPRNTN